MFKYIQKSAETKIGKFPACNQFSQSTQENFPFEKLEVNEGLLYVGFNQWLLVIQLNTNLIKTFLKFALDYFNYNDTEHEWRQ